MARTECIKSARKTKDGYRPNCCTCFLPINIGQSYYKNSPNRFSSTLSWHADCKAPPPSRLESNQKRSTAMAAQEAAYAELDALADTESWDTLVDDCKTILSSCAEGFTEAAGMCTESADNMEEGFGHETQSSDEQREFASHYEEQASNLEDWEPDETTVPSEDSLDDATDAEDVADQLQALREEWRDDVIQSARDKVDEAELH